MSMDSVRGRVIEFARTQQDVRAVVEFGSRARTNRPADEWSDLDLHFITTNPAKYGREAWIEQFGKVWLDYSTTTPHGGIPVRRVVYEGAVDVEFILNDASNMLLLLRAALFKRRLGSLGARLPGLLRGPIDGFIAGYSSVVRQGYRVLVDKDGFSPLLVRALQLVGPPTNLDVSMTSAVFASTVNDFLYQVLWAAKKVLRGETIYAKRTLDGAMKDHLLSLYEADAVRTSGASDVWSKGRFVEEWLSPALLASLRESYTGVEERAVRVSLRRTFELFADAAAMVAAQHGYGSAEERLDAIRGWLDAHAFAMEHS